MMVRLYRPGDAIQSLMEQVYAPGTAKLLLEHPDFDPTRAWVAESDGAIQGFACCTGAFLACAVGACEELLDERNRSACEKMRSNGMMKARNLRWERRLEELTDIYKSILNINQHK